MPLVVPASPKRHGSERSPDKTPSKLNEKPAEKAKNVSHVPCKFFRQSMCQAGDKCPFSHELESDTQAVCKYFQKGNCKFGSKCALAHITADGRQINKKTVKDARRKDRHRDEKKIDKDAHEDADSVAIHNGVSSAPGSGPGVGMGLGAANSGAGSAFAQEPLAPPNNDVLYSPVMQTARRSSNSRGSDATMIDASSLEIASQILSKYSGSAPSSASSTGSIAAVSGTGSPPSRIQANQFNIRSFSASLPRRGSSGWSGLNSNNSSMPLFAEGSAIADDDDDTVAEKDGEYSDFRSTEEDNDSEEEEEGYREQLVPSALQDLLTPLERERRNSRTSQQKPGRVNSSPASSTLPLGFNTRRGSTGSDHSNAMAAGSLWGPRNPVAPFYKNGPFGSPPMSSTPLTGIQPGMQSPPISTASVTQNQTSAAYSHQTYQYPGPPASRANQYTPSTLSSPKTESVFSKFSLPASLSDSNAAGMYQPFQQYGRVATSEKM